MLTKQHLREVLIFCFNWKKSAAEARMLVEVYGDLLQLINHVGNGFDILKDGDFSVEDKPRSGQPKRQRIRGILEEDQSQTQEELAEIGGNSTSRFRTIGNRGNDSKIRKLGAL